MWLKKKILLLLFLPSLILAIPTIDKIEVEEKGGKKIEDKTYKIDDILVFRLFASENGQASTNGQATIDIGIIQQGIELQEKGNGIYETEYQIREGDNVTTKTAIIGHYFNNKKEKASNDGKIQAESLITIDAKRPVITNLSATPSPFNPLIENVKIIYYLTEVCSQVTVKIKNAKFENSRLNINIEEGQYFNRVFNTVGLNMGENRISWNGRNASGELINLMPQSNKIVLDGDYIYEVNAKDKAGNEAIPVVGKIKISVINILVKNLCFSPDPSISGNVKISFEAELKTTFKKNDIIYGGEDLYQLAILDFYPYRYFENPKNSENRYAVNGDNMGNFSWSTCWAKFTITQHKTSGEKIADLWPDWCSDTDSDGMWVQPWGGEFNGFELGLASIKDKGNNNKGDDWDVLCRFSGIIGKNTYTTSFKGIILSFEGESKEIIPGIRIIKIYAELCGRTFERIADVDSQEVKEETWHMKPVLHYGISSSEYFQGTYRVVQPGFIPPDNIPPLILSVIPIGEINAGDIGGKDRDKSFQPRAILSDSEIGSGIDLINSKIKIFRVFTIGEVKQKEELSGTQQNDGINTIYYHLYKEIITPGEYLVEITALDVTGNQNNLEVKFSVTDRQPPEFTGEIPTDKSALKKRFSEIRVTVADQTNGSSLPQDDPNTEEDYKIRLWWKEKKTENLISGHTTFERKPNSETEGTIIFKFNEDDLIDLNDDQPDKYIWEVSASDGKGNRNTKQYTFTLSLDFTTVKLQEKIYLKIPSEIKTTEEGYKIDEIKIYEVKEEEITTKYSDLIILGKIIKFYPLYFSFKEEIELTMHYTTLDKEKTGITITKEKLKIYNWDGEKWKLISKMPTYKENQVIISLKEFSGYYAIMHPLIIAPPEEGKNFFNPYKGEKKVYNTKEIFPGKVIKELKLRVYDIGGAIVRQLTFFGDKETVFWDGKNDIGEIMLNGIYIIIFEVKDKNNNLLQAKKIVAILK